MARVKKPSSAPMFFDTCDERISSSDTFITYYGSDFDYNLDPLFISGAPRHLMGDNIGFVDGHVEWVKIYPGVYYTLGWNQSI